MGKVNQRLIQGVRVVQQVDDHVETVEDTFTVCGELATVRLVDLDAFEGLLDFLVLISQSSYTNLYCYTGQILTV